MDGDVVHPHAFNDKFAAPPIAHDGAVALHGAFWHDGFGQRRSHGCVNLAPADAQFIFDFAPPELPTGWRSVNPIALGLDSLWVEVS